MNIFFTAFVTIFLAELGDKTQLATLLFAADKNHNKWMVFYAAALALICTSAMGVLLGGVVTHYVDAKTLKIIGGSGFIAVGLWTLVSK